MRTREPIRCYVTCPKCGRPVNLNNWLARRGRCGPKGSPECLRFPDDPLNAPRHFFGDKPNG